ncbi:DUF6461 domain-containing protein [Rhodococcus opacus]|uniref:DUF6461 domain-containing protein n=1 Tax=Rhodococcus opacus TaxID=37919 RepID=UPI00247597CA|nr:DUF6461 domain-containing protein [Rhodococcus opacus]MDH6292019.1 hypothetical protein [Rhodococcus opacus]
MTIHRCTGRLPSLVLDQRKNFLPECLTTSRKDLSSKVKTYRDFEWVIRDYPWVENGLFVTYVRDADPTSVNEAMTVRNLGTANGLRGVNERGWEEISIVGAASLGEWTIAIAPATFAGVSERV